MRTSARFFNMLLISLLAHPLYGQFVQEKSFEFLLVGSNENIGVVPAENNFALFYYVDSESLKRRWEVMLMDSNLEARLSKSFEMNLNLVVTHVKYFDGYVYMLLKDINTPMKSIILVRVKKEDGDVRMFIINDLLPKDILGFEIIGNSLFLIGHTGTGPTVMRFTFGDPRPHVMKGIVSKKAEILRTRILQLGAERVIEVITRLKNDNGKGVLYIKQFNEKGEIKNLIKLQSAKGYNLLDALVGYDADGSVCIVGTFSYKKSQLSNGIFTTVVNNRSEYLLYYYDYARLHNFFNWLEPEKKVKIQRKYSGNNSFRYSATVLPKSMQKTKDGWQFLAEVLKFKERYATEYGSMWTQEYKQYSHAIILGLGKDGKLNWDNSISMDDLATSSLHQQVFMDPYEDYTIVYYRNYFHLIYEIIDKGDVVKSKTFYELNTRERNFMFEKVKKDGEIIKWYDNKFITIGSLDVTIDDDKTGKMFILTKISIEPTGMDLH